jgi:hypothetical protein
MLISGRCHCGNISFALDWRPEPSEIPARACICSFCAKHGGVWTSCSTGSRLREGRPESIETSPLHLDILRDLKRIHSHICSVAYPLLETTGELQPNRLRETDVGVTPNPTSDLMPPKQSP